MATDPICGMTVDDQSALSAERDGETFYFCSRHCREKFLTQPATEPAAKHACCADEPATIQIGQAAPPSDASADVYTCPMHPEIEQRGPGSCPKCGMALEPKVASTAAGDEDGGELRDMTRRFWVAAALGLPVFLLAMLPMIGVPVDRWIGMAPSRWLQLVLATPVVLWAGWPLLVRGWWSIMSWNLNMFTLIALGT